MKLPRALLLAAFAAAALAAASPSLASGEVRRPPVTWMKTEENFQPANRRPRQIRYIVVHVTEGSFWGSVEWLQNPAAQGSSHYVIGRRGKIVQLVRERDIAWHAGNRRVNELSLGIEHTGITDDPAGFTTAQYHASARLAAYHARRSLLPITRKRFIGHAEVPSPFEPGARGGADGHTDPGRYWNWTRYLRLVRHYAYPRPQVRAASSTIRGGQLLSGDVRWQARGLVPGVRRVDFLVDGRLRWRDARPPFEFAPGRGLRTTALANGRHVLELRAFDRRGAVARQRLIVRVANAPFVLTTAGLRAGQRVEGVLRVRAAVPHAPASSVALRVDGRRVALDTRAPYGLAWDARRARVGRHVVEVVAVARDGRELRRRFPVLVARSAPRPPSPPPAPPSSPPVREIPPPVLLGQSPADGETVQGTVEWRPRMTGRVVRVDFLVDGVLRHTAAAAPFVLRWDTTREPPGPHALTVRLVGPTGKVTAGTATVTVAPPGEG